MNPYGNDMIVDQVIGSAYQVVRYVAANMETLIELSDSMDTVKPVLEGLQSVIDNMPALLEISGNIPDLLELHSHLSELLVIYNNLSMLSNIHDSLDDIQIIADNLDMLSSNVALLSSIREALRRSYAEAGYNLVDGSFELGGTMNGATDVLLYEAEGKAYSWGGILSKDVSAGSTPSSSGGISAGAWADRSAAPNAFKQAGSGSVLRGAQDKMREIISVTDFGASPANTSAENLVAFLAAEAATDQPIFVPDGLYQLTNPYDLGLNERYYGPGILQFDQADHRRRGGSSGGAEVNERYTIAYEFSSQADVHLLFDGVEQPILSWPTHNTFEASGDSAGKLVVIRVTNGRLKLTEIPQQIAGRNYIGSGDVTPFTPQTAVASSTGGDNTALGSRALLNNTKSNNTAVGSQALMSIKEGGNSTAVGYQALYRCVSQDNTAMGSVSMEWTTTGTGNSCFGFGSGSHIVTGSNNVNVGVNAGADNQDGSHNVNVGYRAGANSGDARKASTVMIGAFAGDLAKGDSNVGIGYRALNAEGNPNSLGTLNVAVGRDSMRPINGGSYNASLGAISLRNLTQGDGNTAVGYNTLKALTAASYNVAIGYEALAFTDTGSQVAVGYHALYSNTTGTENTAIGNAVLNANLTGSSNTGVGFAVMPNTTTSSNTGVGCRAGNALTTGTNFTAVGFEAGRFMASGNNSTFVGFRAGRSSTGDDNTAIGSDALQFNTTGIQNTALGRGALRLAQDASNQTAFNNTTGVGYGASVSGSNQVQLGNSSTTTYVYGTVQNRSDERDKTDIRDTELGIEFIMGLRPVDGRWDMREDYWEEEEYETEENVEVPVYDGDQISHFVTETRLVKKTRVVQTRKDGSKKRERFHHWFIAQEVKELCDRLGVEFGGYQDHSVNGGCDVLSLGYDEFIPPLTKAVQDCWKEIESIKARLDAAGL